MVAGDCWIWATAWMAVIVHLLLLRETLSVAVTEVRLLSDSNNDQFILHGDGATLSCHYLLEPTEQVTEVEWEKDGALVYLWSVDSPPRAMDVLEGKVDLSIKSPSTLVITRAHMDMQGTYTCRVRTNGKTAHNDLYVMVIVDACSEGSWHTHSDRIECTESVGMHCVGMFPKPSPACGVYSERSGRFLSSVPFDSVNLLWNRTYEVSLHRRFTAKDWLQHPDASFRCHLVVLGTTWRSGITHKMFGDPGCTEAPPPITGGHFNVSEDHRSCWGHPGQGSRVEYQCDEPGSTLLGPDLFTCDGGSWVPEGIFTQGEPLTPICSNPANANMCSLIWTIVVVIFRFILKRT